MHYWIDGYNLLFQQNKSDDKLEDLRTQLIEELGDKIDLLEIDSTLVFDSMHQLGGRVKSHRGFMEIVFTSHGETADEYIIEQLEESDPGKVTVVTSDKLLSWRARRLGATTETVPSFLKWLKRRYRNKTSPPRVLQRETFAKKQQKELPASSVAPTTKECIDYYQRIFEEKYKEEAPPPRVIKEAPRPKRKGKHKPRSEATTPHQSPFDRWLKLFEERLEQG